MPKMKPKTKFQLKQYIEITIGVIIMTIGFYFFFIPLNINSGGVGGLSIVLNKIINKEWLKISYLVYGFNIGLLILAYFTLGKKFILRILYPTILYPTIIFILEITNVPTNLIFRGFPDNTATSQLLVAALFGALIVGLGLGMVFNNNTTTGGMDIVQKIINKYLKVPYSVAIYLTDGIIVILGLLAFNVEVVLYGVLSVFLIGLVVDKIIFNGRSGFTAFIITSPAYEEKVKNAIINDLDRGLTKVRVTGGYTDKERSLIICTIARNQTFDLKDYVLRHDPKAFTFIVETREVVGYGFEIPEE
ncbi:MAG TPA: YitT family protein [Acholeplasmataceae bacterium]|nr:YitT family protein [Acholeplasmataceae bacterium]